MPNAPQTEYGAETWSGEATRPVVDGVAVAGNTRADREALNADMMFHAVCARLAHLVEHGVAAQTRAGVLECVADLGLLHEQFTDERARHRRCGQHTYGSWQPVAAGAAGAREGVSSAAMTSPRATATASSVDDPSVIDAAEVARIVGADLERGLTAADAAQRLARNGRKELRGAPPVPTWRRMLVHFQDPLIYLLLAAIAIALTAWWLEGRIGWPIDAF